VTEKNNSRVDCAEADKKTVQALGFDKLSELARKGGDFWRLVIVPRNCPQFLTSQAAKPSELTGEA